MQIATIELGHMSDNVMCRLIRCGHSVVAYDRALDVAKQLAGEGATPATRKDEAVTSARRFGGSWRERGYAVVVGGNSTAHVQVKPDPQPLVLKNVSAISHARHFCKTGHGYAVRGAVSCV
jgi:6-phosphogluconate dehydrogenase (decarboxylating)